MVEVRAAAATAAVLRVGMERAEEVMAAVEKEVEVKAVAGRAAVEMAVTVRVAVEREKVRAEVVRVGAVKAALGKADSSRQGGCYRRNPRKRSSDCRALGSVRRTAPLSGCR